MRLHRFALGILFALSACGAAESSEEIPEGRFSCGMHGGHCEIGSEVCVDDGSGCSKCEPVSSPCDASDDCSCIADPEALGCADAPSCEPSGDGLVVECTASDWGCG